MNSLIDIFILLDSYSKTHLNIFIKKYLDGFTETTGRYWFPSQDAVFETSDFHEMINFLLSKDKADYSFYFDNAAGIGDIKMGMIFFNSDGTLVFGICVREELESFYRGEMTLDFKSDLILISYDSPPPSNKVDFLTWLGYQGEQ